MVTLSGSGCNSVGSAGLILTPEVHCSNPVKGKNFIVHLFTVSCFEMTIINKKRHGMAI